MQATAVLLATAGSAREPFDRIVRVREAQVLRTAYRILGNWADAEDVAQEAFLRLYRHGTGFADDAALGSWLYRVVVNLCLDRVRSAKPVDGLSDLGSRDVSAENALIRGQNKDRLMRAIAELPGKERAAIVLREIEEMSTAEVAAILGSSEVTVRSQISKAMGKLRAILSREEL